MPRDIIRRPGEGLSRRSMLKALAAAAALPVLGTGKTLTEMDAVPADQSVLPVEISNIVAGGRVGVWIGHETPTIDNAVFLDEIPDGGTIRFDVPSELAGQPYLFRHRYPGLMPFELRGTLELPPPQPPALRLNVIQTTDHIYLAADENDD